MELQRLDAAHCRFLRGVLGIPHAFMNRVSNAEVLSRAGRSPARFFLLRSQLNLYGRIVRLPNDDLLRSSLIIRDGIRPAHFNFRRRRGQYTQWANKLFLHIQNMDSSLMMRKLDWENRVKRYVDGLDAEHFYFR